MSENADPRSAAPLSPEPAGEIHRLRGELDRLSRELSAQQHLYLEVSEKLKQQDEDLLAFRQSGAARLASTLQRGTSRVAPPGSARQRWLHNLSRASAIVAAEGMSGLRRGVRRQLHGRDGVERRDLQQQYDQWRQRNEPDAAALDRMREENRRWTTRPLVSVLMPTYDSDLRWLEPAIASVLAQVYDNWELCIADDGSRSPHVRPALERIAADDPRIRLEFRAENGGIAAASATALAMAHGDFIALLDHDDVLRPHALHRMVELLQDGASPDADVVYSDEDVLTVDGRYAPGFFKPDWSPDLLLSVNYVCHLAMLRTDLVRDVGGFRGGFDGSQDHDLLLRVTERARSVAHVADVLYSWRQVRGSVALESSAKMYAYEAGRRAVEEALERRDLPGQVTLGDQLGHYHVRHVVVGEPHVAIVIPTRDRLGLLRECIDSVEALSTYRNWSITIIDNDSARPETLEFFEQTRHRVVQHPGHFNYSALINAARRQVQGDYMITLNNDVIVITPDWIEALLGQAQRPEIGVVGGRLVYPDGRVQHEGIGVGNVGDATTAINLDAGWLGRVTRNVSAVTGACQMIRTAVFDEVGGYDEALHVGYNDVDFCLRVLAAGHLVVYTPHAVLQHRESASRGPLSPDADQALFIGRWCADGPLRDRYINRHVRNLNPMELWVGPPPPPRTR